MVCCSELLLYMLYVVMVKAQNQFPTHYLQFAFLLFLIPIVARGSASEMLRTKNCYLWNKKY